MNRILIGDIDLTVNAPIEGQVDLKMEVHDSSPDGQDGDNEFDLIDLPALVCVETLSRGGGENSYDREVVLRAIDSLIANLETIRSRFTGETV